MERSPVVLFLAQVKLCRNEVLVRVAKMAANEWRRPPPVSPSVFLLAQFKLDRKALAAMVKLQPKDLDKICGDMVVR